MGGRKCVCVHKLGVFAHTRLICINFRPLFHQKWRKKYAAIRKLPYLCIVVQDMGMSERPENESSIGFKIQKESIEKRIVLGFFNRLVSKFRVKFSVQKVLVGKEIVTRKKDNK